MKLTQNQTNAVEALKNNGWMTARDLNVSGSTMKGLVTKGVVEQRRDGMYRLKQKRKMTPLMNHLLTTVSRSVLMV